MTHSSHFVLIVGPIAVGKMTVGQILAKRLGIPLFHNHDSIELALKFGFYGSEVFAKINEGIRKLVFNTFAESDESSGLIFTLVWDFADQRDWDYVRRLQDQFSQGTWTFHLVELKADLEVRKGRNVSENRLLHKPSKRNLSKSQENLLLSEQRHTMNSPEDLGKEFKSYCKIDSTLMSPEKVVDQIISDLALSFDKDSL